MITVYSKPHCPQCKNTYDFLNRHNIDFEVVDVTQDEEALVSIKQAGYRSVPVVKTDTDEWAGFRKEKLEMLL